jgi:hypothetical protein
MEPLMAIYRLLTLSPRPSMEAFRLRCRQALELVDQGITAAQPRCR